MNHVKEILFRYKFIIVPTAVSIISLAAIILIVAPQFFSFIKTTSEISDLKTQAEGLENKASALSLVDLAKINDSLGATYIVLPTDKDVPRAVVILQDLVNRSNLSLKGVTVAAGSSSAKQNSFQLNVSVFGSLANIRNFFILLQNAPQIFQVEAISAEFLKNGTDIHADIPISVFYSPDLPVQVAVNAPVVSLTEKDQESLGKLEAVVKTSTLQPETTAQSTSAATLRGDTSSVHLGKNDPFD